MSYDASNHMIKDDYPNGNGDGVSVYDIQLALGNGTAISENRVGALCSDLDSNGNTITRINKWAKYKPVRIDGLNYQLVDYASRKSVYHSLDVPFCYHNNVLIMNDKVHNIIMGEETGWDYLRPRGDRRNAAQNPTIELYRLSDFVRLSSSKDPDDSSPSSQKGYNHLAQIPFTINVDDTAAGVSVTNNYIQVNSTETNAVEFIVEDNSGNDLKLSDFITTTASAGDDDTCWRPVVQIFNGWVDAQDNYEWYEKPQPDVEFAGDPLIPNQEGKWYFSIDNIEDYIQPNMSTDPWHICIGIGYCKKSGSNIWAGSTSLPTGERLFLPPYTDEQLIQSTLPFYYIMQVFAHPAFDFRFSRLNWYTSSSDSTTVSSDGYNFTVSKNSKSIPRIEIDLLPTKNLHFVAYNSSDGTDTEGGVQYDTLKIKVIEEVYGAVGDTYNLTPVNNLEYPAQIKTGGTYIAQSNSRTTVPAEMTNFNLTNMTAGTTKYFNIYSKIGNAADYSFNGRFSIYKSNS